MSNATLQKVVCRLCFKEFDGKPSDRPHCDDCQRVQFCLDALQEAQGLCNSAAQFLCPVPGYADEWTDLSKPHDAVKAAWYMVEERRQALRPTCQCGSDLRAIDRCPAGHLVCNGCLETHEDCG